MRNLDDGEVVSRPQSARRSAPCARAPQRAHRGAERAVLQALHVSQAGPAPAPGRPRRIRADARRRAGAWPGSRSIVPVPQVMELPHETSRRRRSSAAAWACSAGCSWQRSSSSGKGAAALLLALGERGDARCRASFRRGGRSRRQVGMRQQRAARRAWAARRRRIRAATGGELGHAAVQPRRPARPGAGSAKARLRRAGRRGRSAPRKWPVMTRIAVSPIRRSRTTPRRTRSGARGRSGGPPTPIRRRSCGRASRARANNDWDGARLTYLKLDEVQATTPGLALYQQACGHDPHERHRRGDPAREAARRRCRARARPTRSSSTATRATSRASTGGRRTSTSGCASR